MHTSSRLCGRSGSSGCTARLLLAFLSNRFFRLLGKVDAGDGMRHSSNASRLTSLDTANVCIRPIKEASEITWVMIDVRRAALRIDTSVCARVVMEAYILGSGALKDGTPRGRDLGNDSI